MSSVTCTNVPRMPDAPVDTDVLFVNWRDLSHPEGGGSERYVHRVAEGFAAAGLRVTLLCAAHGRAPAEDVVNGVRIVRRGGRFSVYPRALAFVRRHPPRLVVDVQNGIPFGSPLVTGTPVTVLVHHVHREQWPIMFGRLGGRLGWWVESVLAPRVYRRARYVTVSRATRDEMVDLGIDAERVSIVPVGIEPARNVTTPRSATPELVVLTRLVPHKRVEHALEVLARLSDRWPELRLSVVGEGPCEQDLRAEAERLGVADRVTFAGFVDEQTKHEHLSRAWVHLVPSVKEGWGLVVSEAGCHRVPTIGYRAAGGLRESVVDGVTGVLVDDLDELTAATAQLLDHAATREAMGDAAARHAASFTWPATVRLFAAVLAGAARASAEGDADPALALGDLARALDRIALGVVQGGDSPCNEGDHGGRDGGRHSQPDLETAHELLVHRARNLRMPVEGAGGGLEASPPPRTRTA
jgi:glycosyltransferase involved in cell wall biosynthesis